ncbi:hypothetical protein [Mycetocola zhadangensis]|uniref:Nuclear transport factor 2 family protein n=1 Tax=Mycetocola zhadangensis TaxID=1164595 RepID=A0A3L7IX31_9MICO|nr:hypothetical protein [Mycetocola zhadangensis]RLQ82705.1 hypothetical protein D9V28_12180 [Mycetocola zhadangensis]GGE98921.1 hypothetical protein GCM10011313_22380 [Mycetocola zhadangensis]
MRTTQTPPLLCLALLVGALLVGCTPGSAGGEGIGGDPAASTPAPSRAEGQTLWSVTGTDEQLPDDDPDVQAVRTLITVHSGVIDNRSPENIEASLEEEFGLYTPEFAATLDGVDWRETALERVASGASVVEQRGVAWMQSSIDAERSTASVQYESYVVFTAGDEAFLRDNGITLGAEYLMIREVTAAVHDGEWLISGIRESGLQPRTSPE